MSLFTATLMQNIWSSVFPLIPAALLASLAFPLVRISPRSHGDWQTWAAGSVPAVCAINLCHLVAISTQRCQQLPHCLGDKHENDWYFTNLQSKQHQILSLRFLSWIFLLWFLRANRHRKAQFTARAPGKLEQFLGLTLPSLALSLIRCTSSPDSFLSSFLNSSFTQGSVTPGVPPLLWASSLQSSSQLSLLSWRSRPQPPGEHSHGASSFISMCSQSVSQLPWCPMSRMNSVKEGDRNTRTGPETATSHQPERRGIQHRKVPIQKLRAPTLQPDTLHLAPDNQVTAHLTHVWLCVHRCVGVGNAGAGEAGI